MGIASYEEKQLQEIRNFEECLQDGFELYTTGKSAIEYHFGSKTLRTVFESAFNSEVLRNECIDLTDRLFFIVERDIRKHMKNQLERGLSKEESRVFIRRINVFWQITELMEVDGLLNDEQKSRMQLFLHDIDNALYNFKDKTELRNLTSGLVASLESLSLYGRCSPPLSNDHLSKMDSAIYPTDCDSSIDEDPEEKMSAEMNNHINGLMDALVAGESVTAELVSLHDWDGLLKSCHSNQLSKRLISLWWSLMESKDLRVQESSLRLLRVLLLSTKYRDDLVAPFHHLYIEDKKCLPSFTSSSLLPEGKRVITSLINEMGSHDEMQRDSIKSQRVLNQFHWLALVSPEEVISSLLQRSFTDRRIVAPSVKLLSSLPSLSSLHSSPSSAHPLCMASLVSVARSTDYSIHDEREALVYLIASLTRQKKNGNDKAVVSAHKIFKFFVADSIASQNEDKLAVALSLLIRLFSTGETKHSAINFSTSLGEKNHEENLDSPELLLFLVDVMGRTEQEGKIVLFELAKKAIKQMGSKLREDGVVWDESTSSFILHRLSSHQWFVKVAITQWFSSVLGDPKREIPSGLLLCLSAEQTALFSQIVVPFDFSPVECFLRSLYEVSIWDLPFALSFLDLGVALAPLDDNVGEKVAMAMVDVSSSFSSPHWQALLPFLPLTQRLVNVLDVTIDVRLERINGAIYHSIHNQRALNVIARATKLAFLTNAGDESHDNHNALLQLFCSISKTYIDGEMDSWRKFQKMKAKDAFNGVASLPSDSSMEKVSSSDYVLTQCSTLFPLTVSLTHIVPKVPSCLQVLLSTVSGYLSEFYSRPLPHSLDSAPTGSVPDTTVYAYAQGRKGGHSATNQLFHLNGRESSMGAARAIKDESMATLMERKLAAREETQEKQTNYTANSASSNSNKRRNKTGRKK